MVRGAKCRTLAARSTQQKAELYDLRHWHHRTHLQFTKKVYMNQILGGRHAHLEQPEHALSWKTSALHDLPGLWTPFDQCAFGCCCLDNDNCWRLVKKPTALMTTKMAVHTTLAVHTTRWRCTGDHDHCHLGRQRTRHWKKDKVLGRVPTWIGHDFGNSYRGPGGYPSLGECNGRSRGERPLPATLVKLQAEGHGEALRTVQKLHRNLGHPSPQSLVEMLQSRGASEAVVEAARNYQCVSCLMYKKPNQTPPSKVSRSTEFGEIVQADVMWVKIDDKKFPVMSFVDEATKYQTACLLRGETSGDFIRSIEKGWVKHFGVPRGLHTDEGRG